MSMTPNLNEQQANDETDLAAVLKRRLIRPVSGRVATLLSDFGAQLGEIGWHIPQAAPVEGEEQSNAYADRMCNLAKQADLKKPRILELGAYLHHSAQIAADRLDGTAVTHDISASSVAIGQQRARDAGLNVVNWAVAGDFHALPFADDAFDLVFIASAVHHTYRPWLVIQEMIRVTRPGGVVHLENEPITRSACLFQFRSNRPDGRTPYEQELDRLGLTPTVSSPFPGSRAELLFGMIENDRIPLHVYEDALLDAGKVIDWSYQDDVPYSAFDDWLMQGRTAQEIADKLTELLHEAASAFTVDDIASGFSQPGPDEIWPMAYRVAREIPAAQECHRSRVELLGSSVRISMIKKGLPSRTGALFSREMRDEGGVFIDDKDARHSGITLSNIMPDPEAGQFGPDWHIMQEASGAFTLANEKSVCTLPINLGSGFLILRAYSVRGETPYHFSVMRNNELVYSHWVVASESHLAKIYMEGGEKITIYHHDDEGSTVEVKHFTRLLPRFVSA